MSEFIQKKQRDSNVELLRIIAMLMVMLLHFNNHGFTAGILAFQGALTIHNAVGHFIESFAIIAVDVFVLISGLYGIRFKIKGLFKFYLQCFFFGLVGYLLYLVFAKESIGMAIFGRLFAFSHNNWWFVTTYIILYFTSPLLNFAVQAMSKKDFQIVLLLCTFLTFYWGYFQGYDWGSSYVNFVYLYLIGRYIGKQITIKELQSKRWWFWGLFIVCCLCTFGVAVLKQHYHFDLKGLRPYLYNSWFVIGGAVGLVMFVKSFQFYSKIINWFASSALAAYLLQESTYFGHQILYPWSVKFFANVSGGGLWWLFVFAVSFFIIAVLVDKIGQLLFMPILKLYDKLENSLRSYHRIL